MKSRYKRTLTSLALAAALTGMGACSSDDDDGDGAATDPGAPVDDGGATGSGPDADDPVGGTGGTGGDTGNPGDGATTPDDGESSAMLEEARALLDALEADGGTPYDPATATAYPPEYNVFMPSVTGVDLRLGGDENPSGPTARLPLYKGLDPDGNSVDYIITEASDAAVAELMGIIHSPRMSAGIGTEGAQQVSVDNGIMQFRGRVDFSPERSVTPGDPAATEGPNAITGSTFPPAAVSPGAVADDEWSSLVVLPSGLVLNAQVMANATGIHDRIPDSGQDDQSNPNLDRTNRAVVVQILDGWQGGERYYYHIVTDASVPDAAAIELGVFAPRVGLLPSAGEFPGGARLGFSPNVNGVAEGPDGSQGLNVSVVDQSIDPVNTFPIDPTDERYSPMWDAHLSMWTAEAIEAGERRVITSVEDLAGLVEQGLVTDFVGNDGPENAFIAGLMPANAIINCPVLLQPDASVIGTTFGQHANR